MRYLVTGAAGFLGSHIVEALLARGDDVVGYDHRLAGKCLRPTAIARIQAIEADIFDADHLEQAADGCSAIFHCAAMVGMQAYSGRPARTMETEAIGLANVCRAARKHPGTRVVYASSSAAYGNAGGATPLEENLTVAPISPYAVAKRFCELFLAAQFTEHGLKSAALRVFNVYGPRQDERLVIPRFIRQARSAEPIVIYGTGLQTRDFVYVGDFVDAALAAAEKIDRAEIVNVASGVETSVRDLAAAVIRLTGSTSAIVTSEQPAQRVDFEVERSYGSRTRLTGLLVAGAPTSLDVGLRHTIDGTSI